MIKVDLWEEDGLLDEAATRGEMAAHKFWSKDFTKACIELFALNLDRGYRYSMYICFNDPTNTKNAVDRALGLFVGDPEWIYLRLYGENEKGPLDSSWDPYVEKELRDRLKEINERASSQALKQVQERLSPSMLGNREAIVEHELSIWYAIEHDGEKIAVWVLGPNYLADMITKNVPEDMSKIGKVVGYSLQEADEVVLTDIIEEEDCITAKVRFEVRPGKEVKG
jgi:hypothetical protein